MRRALISVSDKTGVADFAAGLAALGVEILSTGGTAAALREAGHRGAPTSPSSPASRRSSAAGSRRCTRGCTRRCWRAATTPSTWRRCEREGIEPIDLVCVNLYPFERDRRRPRRRAEDEAIENIDIGGPTMIRAAAKNHDGVAVVVKPESYDAVLRRARGVRRRDLGRDPALARQRGLRPDRPLRRRDQPLVLDRVRGLPRAPRRSPTRRCSTSPTARTRTSARRSTPRSGSARHVLSRVAKLHGRALSFNNVLDLDSARRLLDDFERAGLRDRQAQQPLRGGDRRRRARGLREGARLRPDVGLRRRDRPQPAGRRGARRAPARELRRGADRARLRATARSRCCSRRRRSASSASEERRQRDPGERDVKRVLRRPAGPGPRRRPRAARDDGGRDQDRAERGSSGTTCASPGRSSATSAPTRS